jgi:hypothetical protein
MSALQGGSNRVLIVCVWGTVWVEASVCWSCFAKISSKRTCLGGDGSDRHDAAAAATSAAAAAVDAAGYHVKGCSVGWICCDADKQAVSGASFDQGCVFYRGDRDR